MNQHEHISCLQIKDAIRACADTVAAAGSSDHERNDTTDYCDTQKTIQV